MILRYTFAVALPFFCWKFIKYLYNIHITNQNYVDNMCGIAGIIGPLAEQDYLYKILKPISHRGELRYQNETLTINKKFALGMHRLAIVDEMHGLQPKLSPDEKVICIFNGEIYNYLVLKNHLSQWFQFSSGCDTEVVLFAYYYWGRDFVKNLDGKFAIAIYDRRTSTLILARDPMGVKPLYYSKIKENIIFASEVKSLSQLPEVENIEELEPGSIMVNLNIEKYFKLPKFKPSKMTLFNSLKKLDKLLSFAVKKRIPQNAKSIACLLSGGIDSSIITYLACKTHPNVIAYTLAIDQDHSEDLKSAKILCDHFGIQHKIISPSVKELQDFYLQHGVYLTESFEPVLVRNAVSYHFLCREVAKDGFKYCLNGEGADELFGGYDFIYEAPIKLRIQALEYSLQNIHRTYLQMADRASMYTTLEARVPFMDKQLVKFCLTLGSELRFYNNKNKFILRKLYEDQLPEMITNRSKVGMNQGSGYGCNLPAESIYYKGIYQFYQKYPKKLRQDLSISKMHIKSYNINLTDYEEVYNFARFYENSFYKLDSYPKRLHLNTPLKYNLIWGPL